MVRLVVLAVISSIYGLAFHLGRGYIAGTGGKVFTSTATDSFSSWTSVTTTPVSFQINCVSSYDGTIVYVVGAGGRMYKSSNSGSTWTSLTTGATAALYTISEVGNSTLMVQGASLFAARTTNGGTSWTRIYPFSSGTTTSTRPPHALSMLTTSIAISCNVSGELKQTVNGGSRWTSATTLGVGRSIFSVSMYSTDVGIAGKSLLY